MFTRVSKPRLRRWWRTLAPTITAMALIVAPMALDPVPALADPGSALLGSPYNGSDGVLDSGIAKAPDPVGTADSTNYSVGSKEDDTCPSVVPGTASSKNDFDYTAADATPTSSGVFVYLAWHRGDGQGGTTSMDFELNQSTLLACNNRNPVRTTGDLLIGYDYLGNDTVPTLTIRTWDNSAQAWVAQTPAQAALLAANSEAHGGENGAFGEMVINMTGAGIFDPHQCENLATAFAKSRSSNSFQSEIKDFTTPIGLSASNCGAVSFLKVDETGAAISGVTFTLLESATGPAVEPEKSCTTGTDGRCTIVNVWPGGYWVSESNVPSTNTAVAPFPITVELTSNSLRVPLAAGVSMSDGVVRVVNPRKPVHISIHKQDDQGVAMGGVQFGLSTDSTAVHVISGATCTTASPSGNCTITATVNTGDYWVVEMSSPDGYHAAAAQQVHLVPGGTIAVDHALVFVDASMTSHLVLDTSAASPLDVEVNSTLTYQLTITNDGELPLTITALTDSLKSPLPASCPQLGSVLAAGASVSCSYTAPANDPGAAAGSRIHNHASVAGTDQFNRTPSSADDTYVHVLNPAIHIIKEADAATVHLGDTIHYTLTVTNTGNTPLENVTVTDAKCDSQPTLTSKQGSDNWLDLDETWVYGCSHTTTSADEGSVLNSAVASGTDKLGFTVTSRGEVTTAIIDPHIHLTKAGAVSAHVGDTIAYTLTVTNPGNTPLHNVVVTDAKCDSDPVRTARQGGDEFLDPGEVWVYGCSHVVVEGDPDQLVNSAHVDGTDGLDHTVGSNADW